jgi:Glycosyltransferase Family 4
MTPRVTPPPALAMQTAAFVLVSYRPDEPAGMERAVAAMSAGLRERGHRVLILTAAPQPRPDTGIVRLRELPVTFPCDDNTLRNAAQARQTAIARELDATLTREQAHVVVYVDGLWGLGRLAAAVAHRARRVLAVHVVGHHTDLAPALAAAHRVIAPSAAVLAEAGARGYDPAAWRVVPNPLLVDPGQLERPDAAHREQLRRHGPVRIVARLGPEKGVASLLAAAAPGSWPRQQAGADRARASRIRGRTGQPAGSPRRMPRPRRQSRGGPAARAGLASGARFPGQCRRDDHPLGPGDIRQPRAGIPVRRHAHRGLRDREPARARERHRSGDPGSPGSRTTRPLAGSAGSAR